LPEVLDDSELLGKVLTKLVGTVLVLGDAALETTDADDVDEAVPEMKLRGLPLVSLNVKCVVTIPKQHKVQRRLDGLDGWMDGWMNGWMDDKQCVSCLCVSIG
jgi:hypothetical protein